MRVFCIGTGAHKRPLRYTEKIPGIGILYFFLVLNPTQQIPKCSMGIRPEREVEIPTPPPLNDDPASVFLKVKSLSVKLGQHICQNLWTDSI